MRAIKRDASAVTGSTLVRMLENNYVYIEILSELVFFFYKNGEWDSNPETFECRPSALPTQPPTLMVDRSKNKPSHLIM